jgi:hypothetical protein
MSSRSGPLDQRPGRAEVRQADARPIDGDQTHAEAGRQAVIGVAGEARIAEAVDKKNGRAVGRAEFGEADLAAVGAAERAIHDVAS